VVVAEIVPLKPAENCTVTAKLPSAATVAFTASTRQAAERDDQALHGLVGDRPLDATCRHWCAAGAEGVMTGLVLAAVTTAVFDSFPQESVVCA